MQNTIMVIPNEYKKEMLYSFSMQKELCTVSFMTLEELIEKITYKTNVESLYYLMKKYGFSYSIANMYLTNLRYVYDLHESQNAKIQGLIDIRNELEEQHLLERNPYFKNYIKGKILKIKGYHLTKTQKTFLASLESIATIEVMEEDSPSYLHPVYEFETIEEEVSYIASDICKQLQNGVSINRIYLTNVTSEYEIPLNRIFRMYHIPLEEQGKHSLYGNTITQKWLSNIEEQGEAFEAIQDLIHTEEEQQIYEQLVSIYNDYAILPKDEVWLEFIKEECKKRSIQAPKWQHAVRIKNLRESVFKESDRVYVLGLNQENIPRTFQDENYLNDADCTLLKMDTTIDQNQQEKELVIQKINAIPNGMITYKKKTPFGTYYPSSLLGELNVEKQVPEKCYQYSDAWNQLELAKQLDQYIQYNEKGDTLDLLYAHYPNTLYASYNNRYEPISKDHLASYLNDKLLLSYTSLDHYYHCGFRYYAGHILKVDAYEETFAQKIGNLFHYFLSVAFKEDFDFEKEWLEYHKEQNYTAKEQFFLKKLKRELLFVIDTIKEQNQYTSLTDEKYEQKIFKSITGNLKITFMGIVDKIKYEEQDGIVYAAIIDYKTGTLETNLNQSIYGIGMQLPIYLYLVKNQPNWNAVKVVGFYLQKMVQNEMSNDENKDYLDLKKDNMKLEGYSIDQMDVIEKLDQTYADSRMIKSLKVSKSGFYAYSKVMNEEKMNRLTQLVENKIKEAAHRIENADFQVNPKQIGTKLVGCEFCKYHDLCFKTARDIVHLKEYKKLEFLEEGAV